MDFSERAAIQEIVDRVSSDGPKEHLHSVLRALKLVQGGAQSFREPDPGGAVGLGERVLKELQPIPGVEKISALVRVALIAQYAQTGRYDAAIAVGFVALPPLANDARLAYSYAACLHDLGGVLVESGRLTEGADFIEQAMSIYEHLPNSSGKVEFCRANLERVRALLAKHGKEPSIWSRLFRKR